MPNKRVTALYERSPVWLQNLAIGTYGLRLRATRYGGEFQRILAELQASDRLDRPALEALQRQLLQSTVRDAIANIPYYRESFGGTIAALDGIQVADLPGLFPVLRKERLRRSPAEFIRAGQEPSVTIQTSGSTGSPLQVTATRGAVRRNYAFFARFLGWHGVTPFDESATFAGRIFARPGSSQPSWRRNWAMNDTLFSSYDLSEQKIPSYVRELERRAPRFIDSYPSSVFRIASYLDKTRVQHGIRPQVIVTSSETLLAQQREVISRVFGCPVRDQYGSAEMVGFIAECERGGYHAASEYGVVELLDQAGKPVAPGELGQVCLTGFVNPAMPLIRYAIGDMARMSKASCDCGRASPLLLSIEGRVDDVIVTPSGRHVGRLDPAFKGVSGVRESQILQTALDRVVVKVVSDDPQLVDPRVLIANLAERLGSDVQVSVEFVPAIDKEANGKLRSVKSLLNARRAD
jgi:phenylacetate-CoA ligase